MRHFDFHHTRFVFCWYDVSYVFVLNLFVRIQHLEMNMYTCGEKVQAVDEIGRWEMAKILEVFADPILNELNKSLCLYKVRFTGWGSDFDRKVNEEEIRLPVAIRPLGKWQDISVQLFLISQLIL